MGFRLTWLKITGKSRNDILRLLGVTTTGQEENDPNEGMSGRLCPDGSYLFVAASDEARHLDPRFLGSLSAGADLVACHVHEGSMTSSAAGWKDGHEIWRVVYDCESEGSTKHLEIAGLPPAALREIHTEKQARQTAEARRRRSAPPYAPSFDLPAVLAALQQDMNRDKHLHPTPMPLSLGVDHIFDVPVALCEALTGLRHDHVDFWSSPFESLVPCTLAPTSRSSPDRL